MRKPPECFICGRTDVPIRVKTFEVLWYWIEDFICEPCFEVGKEPDCGEWSDPRPWADGPLPVRR